jgi:hypothetical protein
MIRPALTEATSGGLFGDWVRDFQTAQKRRHLAGDPDWPRGAVLDAAVARSLQRFQLGESGDGANLAAKASRAGDESYAAAARLFIAEEQNHARLLAELLAAAGVGLISFHWSDTVFVRLRRALGLRLELMVLFVAEFIALFYYRACRDGAGDQLARDVAGRILADEERHVRFHTQRLQLSFAQLPAATRRPVCWAWLLLMTGTAVTVAFDHGAALARYGVQRGAFTAQVLRAFTTVTSIRQAATRVNWASTRYEIRRTGPGSAVVSGSTREATRRVRHPLVAPIN